jgi:hypothetical protein
MSIHNLDSGFLIFLLVTFESALDLIVRCLATPKTVCSIAVIWVVYSTRMPLPVWTGAAAIASARAVMWLVVSCRWMALCAGAVERQFLLTRESQFCILAVQVPTTFSLQYHILLSTLSTGTLLIPNTSFAVVSRAWQNEDLLTYFPYFEKNKNKTRLMRLPCCLCVCIFPPC